MYRSHPEVVDIVHDLVSRGAFEIVLQPIVAPRQRQVLGFEALSRFAVETSSGQSLDTASVIEVIEAQQLSRQFDLLVLDKALSAMAELSGLCDRKFPLSINICKETLACRATLAGFRQRLDRAGVPPAMVQFEIAEKALLGVAAQQILYSGLVDGDVQLAVDDFVSGDSNFGALTCPLIHTIKLSRSVARELSDSDTMRGFVRGLLILVESLGKQMVVKGVETHAQFGFLDAIGCNRLQGYYFAPPMSVTDVTAFLSEFQNTEVPAFFSPQPGLD